MLDNSRNSRAVAELSSAVAMILNWMSKRQSCGSGFDGQHCCSRRSHCLRSRLSSESLRWNTFWTFYAFSWLLSEVLSEHWSKERPHIPGMALTLLWRSVSCFWWWPELSLVIEDEQSLSYVIWVPFLSIRFIDDIEGITFRLSSVSAEEPEDCVCVWDANSLLRRSLISQAIIGSSSVSITLINRVEGLTKDGRVLLFQSKNAPHNVGSRDMLGLWAADWPFGRKQLEWFNLNGTG